MTATPTNPPVEGCIDSQVLDHVLLIGINRPAKRNGWTPPMFKQLAEAYTRLDDDPALRVGVLHAFGDPASPSSPPSWRPSSSSACPVRWAEWCSPASHWP